MMKNFIVEDFCSFSLGGIIEYRGAEVYFGSDHSVSWYELPFSRTVDFLAYCNNDFIRLDQPIYHDFRGKSTGKSHIDLKPNTNISGFDRSNIPTDDYGRIGIFSEGYWKESNDRHYYEYVED